MRKENINPEDHEKKGEQLSQWRGGLLGMIVMGEGASRGPDGRYGREGREVARVGGRVFVVAIVHIVIIVLVLILVVIHVAESMMMEEELMVEVVLSLGDAVEEGEGVEALDHLGVAIIVGAEVQQVLQHGDLVLGDAQRRQGLDEGHEVVDVAQRGLVAGGRPVDAAAQRLHQLAEHHAVVDRRPWVRSDAQPPHPPADRLSLGQHVVHPLRHPRRRQQLGGIYFGKHPSKKVERKKIDPNQLDQNIEEKFNQIFDDKLFFFFFHSCRDPN